MSTESRRRAFMHMFRGIHAYTVARAVSNLTPGIDWTGCSKGHIATEWADKDAKAWHKSLCKLTLVQIARQVEKVQELMETRRQLR